MKKISYLLGIIFAVAILIGCNSPTGDTGDENPITGEPIQFDIQGSVGLALVNDFNYQGRFISREVDDNNRSNLKKVDSSGNLSDVLTSGSALISKFMIAPNNKLYVLFTDKINLETSEIDSENGCLMAEVNLNNGTITSIDSALMSIKWNDDNTDFKNKPIQFDNYGSIYYSGNNGTNEILRKYSNGVASDIINDNINIDDFVVNDDGSLIISGRTVSTNTYWIRKVTTSGGLQNIVTSAQAHFLSKFPDDNIYMGLWSEDYFGVYRYLINSNSLESDPWISGTNINDLTFNPYNDIDGTILETGGYWGALVKNIIMTSNGKVYATARSGDDFNLAQYYPTLASPNTSIEKVSVIQGILSSLIISGLNSTNTNKTVLYDTGLDSEEDLLAGYNIEVYNINYIASENKIMFDGLNFADNKMVLGEVSLTNKQVNLVTLGDGTSAKLLDFKTF